MALLGTFAPADEADGVVTSGSRTTVAGSLVVAAGAIWSSSSSNPDVALSSNQAGTYTEAFEDNSGPANDAVAIALAYNIGGTRAAGHTVTNTGTLGLSVSVSGAEFDGIDATPTVTVGTVATGDSTTPSCTVTVPAGTATVVAVMTYQSVSTTIAVSNGTEATEADENNSNQAHAMAYKLAQGAGVVTIAWTLGAQAVWVCHAVAFEEAGGGAAVATPAQGAVVGTGRGVTLGFAVLMPDEP